MTVIDDQLKSNAQSLKDIAQRLDQIEKRQRQNTSRGTPGNFTAGSVLFAGTDGRIDQNNTTLFWNNSTNRLQVVGNINASAAYGSNVIRSLESVNTGIGLSIFSGEPGVSASNGVIGFNYTALSGASSGREQSTGGAIIRMSSAGTLTLNVIGTGGTISTMLDINTTGMAFFGTSAIAKPTVTGSRGGNAALASLLTALANLGLIVNSSTV